jgi:hypothetical protein
VKPPLDPSFPIERQITIDIGPVVLVNVFTLDKADEEAFLNVWEDDAAFMKRQHGFISAQLHRAIGENPTYLNYAVWESTAAFRVAFGVQGETRDISRLRRCFPAPVPNGGGTGHLRRIAVCMKWVIIKLGNPSSGSFNNYVLAQCWFAMSAGATPGMVAGGKGMSAGTYLCHPRHRGRKLRLRREEFGDLLARIV